MRIARFIQDTDPAFGVVDGEEGFEEIAVIKGDPFFSGVQLTGSGTNSRTSGSAPIIPRSKVVGIGRNYADHAAEMGNDVPPAPLMFLKPNTSVIGPNDPIVLPSFSEEVSYEAELAVVIGRICKDVPLERVDEVVFGYTCANDLTARDAQRTDDQWARAKGFDTSCPIGPWIETELDTDNLAVRAFLDGEQVQNGNTDQMIWGVRELVSYVSQAFTLLPGDIILTGTPAGVGLITEGQRIEVKIEGIGTLANIARA